MNQSAQTFLRQLGDPAVILDHSGEIRFANAEFRDLVGDDLTTLDVASSTDSTFPGEQVDDATDQTLDPAIDVFSQSVSITTKDGSTEIDLTLHPVAEEIGGDYFGIVRGEPTPSGEPQIDAWASVMEQLPDITPLIDISCLLTPRHEFISVNEEATEPFGMSPADFQGEVCYELVHDQDEPIDACPCEEALNTREAITGNEFQENGRHYIGAAAPIFAADGEIAAIAHTVRDITDRKRREETLDQYRQAIEASDDLIVAIDTDETYMFANSTYREYYDVDDIVGKPVKEVVDRETFETEISPRNQSVFDGTTLTYERTGTFPELGKRTLAVKLTPIRNGSSITGLIAVFRDITERKEREEELRRQNDRLDEFASVLSHDLRNPLNVASGRLTLAREESQSEHLDAAATAIDRSLEMIEDVLTLARKGQPVSEFRTVNLATVVEEAWQSVDTPSATLEVGESPSIRAHPGRLRQLLENLIRNAVEHGGEDVTVTVGEMTDGFYVADDGTGIPAERREDVFERGYTTAEDGTGLGLQIVSDIVDAHDWDVTLTESTEGGAQFEITGVETVLE